MAEPWDLVLHHTYAGAPGVIFDHSPSRRSHGQPVGLTLGDFLTDGAGPDSGAVQFHSASMIRVQSSASWRPLGGVRIEMVCETDMVRNGGPLVTGESFSFSTSSGFFSGEFGQTHGGASAIAEGGSEPRPLPGEQWMTLALQYDPGGVQAEINGVVVNRWEGWNGLLAPTSGIVIGNDFTGQHGLNGRIDDLKIWRLHPQFIGNIFVDRPVDTAVGRCWAEWSRKLDDVFRADPQCAQRVTDLLQRAMFRVMSEIASLPNIEPQFAELSLCYRESWSGGRLDQIPAVLADLIALLRGAGFNPAQIADVQALQNDPCFRSFIEQLPIDCDVAFTDMFSVSESF
jgi:Concanavalin A-like lectin/glucanases superfamily